LDKYEYKLKLEQLKNLADEKDYKTAADIADSINWRKVKSAATLCMVGEIYDRVKRYDDSHEILMMAYDRAAVGRNILYRLTLVSLKMGNLDEAKEHYEEFLEVAPYDNQKYILRYQIAKLGGADLQELIDILEEFKSRDYTEEWAFELAYLYHRAGMGDNCVEVCDELELWFGDGRYVEKALDLKMLYQPLSPEQEEKYRQFKQNRNREVEVRPTDTLDSGELVRETMKIPDITVGTSRYNTSNMQAEIAKNMKQIMDADSKESVDVSMDAIKKMVKEIPYLKMPVEEEELPEAEPYGHIETDEEIDGSLRTEFQEMLAEDWDGQVRLSVQGGKLKEPQVNGQMKIEDVLAEWERTKLAAQAAMATAQERKLVSAKARALQEAEELLAKLNEIIPKLEAGVSPQELMAERYLHHMPGEGANKVPRSYPPEWNRTGQEYENPYMQMGAQMPQENQAYARQPMSGGMRVPENMRYSGQERLLNEHQMAENIWPHNQQITENAWTQGKQEEKIQAQESVWPPQEEQILRGHNLNGNAYSSGGQAVPEESYLLENGWPENQPGTGAVWSSGEQGVSQEQQLAGNRTGQEYGNPYVQREAQSQATVWPPQEEQILARQPIQGGVQSQGNPWNYSQEQNQGQRQVSERVWPPQEEQILGKRPTLGEEWQSEAQGFSMEHQVPGNAWSQEQQTYSQEPLVPENAWSQDQQVYARESGVPENTWPQEQQAYARESGVPENTWSQEQQTYSTEPMIQENTWPQEREMNAPKQQMVENRWPQEQQTYSAESEMPENAWSQKQQAYTPESGMPQNTWSQERHVYAPESEMARNNWSQGRQAYAPELGASENTWYQEQQAYSGESGGPENRWPQEQQAYSTEPMIQENAWPQKREIYAPESEMAENVWPQEQQAYAPESVVSQNTWPQEQISYPADSQSPESTWLQAGIQSEPMKGGKASSQNQEVRSADQLIPENSWSQSQELYDSQQQVSEEIFSSEAAWMSPGQGLSQGPQTSESDGRLEEDYHLAEQRQITEQMQTLEEQRTRTISDEISSWEETAKILGEPIPEDYLAEMKRENLLTEEHDSREVVPVLTENFLEGNDALESQIPFEELIEQQVVQETEEQEEKDAGRYLQSVFQAARESREEKIDVPKIKIEEPEEHIRKLSKEQKEIFSYFVPITGMEQQLCQALEGVLSRKDRDDTSSSGNILIMGGRGSGKTVLATDFIKAIQHSGRHPNGKVGKITGASLNEKDLGKLVRKIAGGYLIIEKAGDITKETAIRLSCLMDQSTGGLLVIMEDTRKGIEKALSKDAKFAQKFTERIKIPVFTSDELVEFAKTYAEEQECEIDDMGILALYNRISNIQKLDEATTLTEVKDIVDDAISRAERGGLKKLFGGKKFSPDGYLYLREKDFQD
jgi:tetratricopeptide (TPR) repeat protein